MAIISDDVGMRRDSHVLKLKEKFKRETENRYMSSFAYPHEKGGKIANVTEIEDFNQKLIR